MIRVVDASVALRWFIDAPGTPAAMEVLTGDRALLAPDLVVSEIGNAAWKLQRVGEISAEHGRRLVSALPSAFAKLIPSSQLCSRAFEMAIELDHPLYDCMYLALAEREDAGLVSADRRLFGRVAHSRWSGLVTLLPVT